MARLTDLPEDQRVFAFKALLALVFFLLVPLFVIWYPFGFDPSHPNRSNHRMIRRCNWIPRLGCDLLLADGNQV